MKTNAILISAVFAAFSLLFVSCASSNHCDLVPIPGREIEVRVNTNIELFGLLMQLDLAPDVLSNKDIVELDGRKAMWSDWYSGALRNYARFKQFEDGAMMKTYREALKQGFYNDFLIGFLLEVPEVPNARLTPKTDPEMILPFSKTGDRTEAERKAGEFLDAMNQFYREINFADYLKDNQKIHDRMKAEVSCNMPPAGFIWTMESFYGQRFNDYCLVPSLNIPTSMGFGKTHLATRTIYNVFGPFTFQSFDEANLDLGFNRMDKIQNLSVHEFGHSFVNPCIDRVPAELIKQTEPLYTPLAEAMKKQSYTSWNACLYEHFVRAGEVIIARKLGNNAGAERKLVEDLQKGFAYLPQIVRELESFDQRANRQETYQEKVGEIIQHLADQQTGSTVR